MGRDFNTYGLNPLDRSAPTPRSGPSIDMGVAFQQWMQSIGLLSTFRHRHPSLLRHTYARNNTSVALDDIYITAISAHILSASGIWLHTIHSIDHAGTPFMDLALCSGDHTPSRLSGVKPTRSLTKGDITTFDTTDWLEASVQNLYDILYTSAKIQWGETSHIRKALNRAVAIQRTNRGRISNLRLAHMVELPKWIRIPNLPPSTCWHSFGAIAIGHRTLEKCMSQKARLAYHLHPTNPRAPTNRMVPRPPNAEIPPISTRSTHSTHSIQSVIIRPADVLPRYSSDQEEIHSDRLQGPTLSVTASSMIWIAQTSVVAQAFQTPAGTTWDTTYHYDADMQARCDRSLHTRVSPGYGGVSQELWISASACIRERERTVINLILRTCLVPPILEHKQMIYLAKSAIARGVVNLDLGLPPWRPIIVQTALNSRIFTVIRDYISPCLPNQEMQNGFQWDRTVQAVAVLTSLLIERAERRQEELFLISKDCLKCFDRIQAGSWSTSTASSVSHPFLASSWTIFLKPARLTSARSLDGSTGASVNSD
ncbi:hypothetical protein H257_17441 [Aphanomyces astaci]|uniref:Uncharacterized protein n=1 Tax=Aphanomyces astaci TaxID=112090 RepID=W4FGS5_APHAT|nr:hypothetical protein H257_17441 [Aphanomyces astaci]ETV65963.1 hypothetical protein H257_17441 [Aphanomyces astaci]|eukprot:XP_009844542.1 hypothetical protein H257_17441 [Aphanomyces astaci]